MHGASSGFRRNPMPVRVRNDAHIQPNSPDGCRGARRAPLRGRKWLQTGTTLPAGRGLRKPASKTDNPQAMGLLLLFLFFYTEVKEQGTHYLEKARFFLVISSDSEKILILQNTRFLPLVIQPGHVVFS
jgi:hypothetical protein